MLGRTCSLFFRQVVASFITFYFRLRPSSSGRRLPQWLSILIGLPVNESRLGSFYCHDQGACKVCSYCVFCSSGASRPAAPEGAPGGPPHRKCTSCLPNPRKKITAASANRKGPLCTLNACWAACAAGTGRLWSKRAVRNMWQCMGDTAAGGSDSSRRLLFFHGLYRP